MVAVLERGLKGMMVCKVVAWAKGDAQHHMP